MMLPQIARQLSMAVFFLLASLLSIGCGGSNGGANNSDSNAATAKTFEGEYPFLVVTTTGMVADIVLNVAGDHVTVLETSNLKIEHGDTSLGNVNHLAISHPRVGPAAIDFDRTD